MRQRQKGSSSSSLDGSGLTPSPLTKSVACIRRSPLSVKNKRDVDFSSTLTAWFLAYFPNEAIDADGLFDGLVIPKRQANFLWTTSWLSLFSAFYALNRGLTHPDPAQAEAYLQLSVAPFVVWATSINYWRKPDYSWRRYFDISCVHIGLVNQSLRAINSEHMYLYCLLIVLGCTCFKLSIHFHKRNVQWLSTFFHGLVHVLGNLSNLLLFSGLVGSLTLVSVVSSLAGLAGIAGSSAVGAGAGVGIGAGSNASIATGAAGLPSDGASASASAMAGSDFSADSLTAGLELGYTLLSDHLSQRLRIGGYELNLSDFGAIGTSSLYGSLSKLCNLDSLKLESLGSSLPSLPSFDSFDSLIGNFDNLPRFGGVGFDVPSWAREAFLSTSSSSSSS